MTEPIHVTKDTFEDEVIQSGLPVLTDFWATWCGPCHMIAPILEQIAAEYEGQLKVAKLDVDQNVEIAARYGVQSIPTLILFKKGQEMKRVVGFKSKEKLIEELELHSPL